MSGIPRRDVAILVAIMALALGLRAWGLDSQSLWNDEGTSVALAQRSIPAIIEGAAHDIHPPLYYVLLHYWVNAFGISETAVRGLSVLMGGLVVAGTWALARSVLTARASLLAAFLAALSPFQVYYAQETRMYILSTLAAVALVGAAHALLREWSHGGSTLRSWRAVAVLLTGVAMLYTHYYGATVVLAVNLGFLIWLLERRRQTCALPWPAVARWAVIQGLTLVAFMPWLLRTWSTLVNWPAVSEAMTLRGLAVRLMTVMPLGITVPEGTASLLLGLFATALALGGLISLWHQTRSGAPDRPRWPAAIVALYLVVPLAVMALGSLRRPMVNPKFILLATPALHTLLAAGVAAVARPWPGTALTPQKRVGKGVAAALLGLVLVAGSAWSLRLLYTDPRYARDDYRAIIEYVRATAGSGAAILINAPSQIETVDYYHDEPPPMFPLARERPMNVDQTIAELEAIVQRYDQLYGIFWATADSDPDGIIERWLAEHTAKTMDRWYGNIRLVVYATPPEGAAAAYVPVDYRLGEGIRLRGYRVLPATVRSGEILQVSLQWETAEAIGGRYTVFAQLLDAQRHIVGQHDSEPVGGAAPTSDWAPGEVVTDNHGILVEPGTIPGPHTLVVGMYDATTGARLPVTANGVPAGDAVTLADVAVESPVRLPAADELGMRATDGLVWGSLELLGHSLYPVGRAHEPDLPVHPGDSLELVLYWRKSGANAPPDAVRLTLVDRSGTVVWQSDIPPAHGVYDWGTWRDGETVRDVWHIALPVDAPSGTWRLTAAPVGAATGRPAVLERIRVLAP